MSPRCVAGPAVASLGLPMHAPPCPPTNRPHALPLHQGPLVMLAMKHMEGGSLHDVLRRPGAADELTWHDW